jgi:hypothetical protein
VKYNPTIVRAFWQSCGLPAPVTEHRFHPERKWRFDFAFPTVGVAVEVQGGIWTRGRHTRGAALKLEWEKLNTAAAMGWRILFCEPNEVTTTAFAKRVKAAVEFGNEKADRPEANKC